LKICRTCKTRFESARPFETWCSPACGTEQAVKKLTKWHAKKAAEERRDTRARLAVLVETKPKLLKLAQKAFNDYIRARDAGKPCICCGQFTQGEEALTGGAWDAGHYRSRGACPELAFDERNCHAQLKRCNRRAWDVAGYRAELVRRIGAEAVAELEGHHPPKHYSRDDLRAIRATYQAKTKALQK
jgi:Bacteriophage Lambda NinG protein